MDKSIVGIKIANGDFYPVLDTNDTGAKKRLVLSPARKDQSVVKVDLYRASSRSGEGAEYVGALHIEGPAETEHDATIEMILIAGIDAAGNLNATLSDPVSGEYQSLSVSLLDLPGSGEDGWDLPEEEMLESSLFEDPMAAELDAGLIDSTFDEALDLPDAADSDDLTAEERAEEEGARPEVRRPARVSPLLFVAYVVLSLLILGIVAYLIFRSMRSSPIPQLLSIVRPSLFAPTIGHLCGAVRLPG